VIIAGPDDDTSMPGDGNNIVSVTTARSPGRRGFSTSPTPRRPAWAAWTTLPPAWANDTIFRRHRQRHHHGWRRQQPHLGDNGEATYLAGVPVRFVTFAPADAGNDIITSRRLAMTPSWPGRAPTP